MKARAQEAFDLEQFVLKISGEGDVAQKKADQRQNLLDGQACAEAVREPNAHHQDRPQRGHGLAGRTVRAAQGVEAEAAATPAARPRRAADAQDNANSRADDSQDATATRADRTPATMRAAAGSARVAVSAADGEADEAGPGDDSAGDGDEASSSQRAWPAQQPPPRAASVAPPATTTTEATE